MTQNERGFYRGHWEFSNVFPASSHTPGQLSTGSSVEVRFQHFCFGFLVVSFIYLLWPPDTEQNIFALLISLCTHHIHTHIYTFHIISRIIYTQMHSEYAQKLLLWNLTVHTSKGKSPPHNLEHGTVNLPTWIDSRRIKDNYILEFAGQCPELDNKKMKDNYVFEKQRHWKRKDLSKIIFVCL